MSKVAIVTGGTRGIGAAISAALKNAGYSVAANYAGNDEAAQKFKAETGIPVYKWSVADYDACAAGIKQIEADLGPVSVLVNNAGILKPSLLQDLDEANWDAHFDVNAKGVLMMCQAVLPHMRARKSGRVINIASIAGRQGVPTQGHYAATKAVVITLTRVLAQEVGMDGVTVNAICPGIILTEMGKNNLGSEAAIRHWEDVAALKRLGAPEDIIGPVLFFASDLSAFVTGQALNVDGGIYYH
ncbi:MAG: SDR family oxidoreductase [Mesorhizobium sp.]|nr:MAG: SDR family oxidoreductase [Mesorhizobium sp.]